MKRGRLDKNKHNVGRMVTLITKIIEQQNNMNTFFFAIVTDYTL
jgi:hypothetical protein